MKLYLFEVFRKHKTSCVILCTVCVCAVRTFFYCKCLVVLDTVLVGMFSCRVFSGLLIQFGVKLGLRLVIQLSWLMLV